MALHNQLVPLGCSGSRVIYWGQRSGFHRVDAQKKGGIPCGLQRLSYAGKHMDDSQRTLEQCARYPAHAGICSAFVAP